MTQEGKQLLFKDLSARLPYGIYANLPNHHLVSHRYNIYEFNAKNEWTTGILYCAGREEIYGAKIEDIQPYLRPISSMTEDEQQKYYDLTHQEDDDIWGKCLFDKMVDFCNENHLDYRGLIEKGLALEAPEDMYKIKQNLYGEN